MVLESKVEGGSFVSSLGEGRAAFLAELTEYSLAIGERSGDTFIEHFSCSQIMQALEQRPEERAKILTNATSTHAKIAPRMSAEAAAETLQIALDEGLTNAKQIVELLAPDDRQRYLNDRALWAFAVSGEPAKSRSGADLDRAKSFVRYLLDRALVHKLVGSKELVSALSVARLTTSLPPVILAAIIEASLDENAKFSHDDVVRLAPPEKLVAHLPLDYIWHKVVLPLIAERHVESSGGNESAGTGEGSTHSGSNGAEVSLQNADDGDNGETTAIVDAENIGPDEDVLLDDDDEEVHTVSDDDDVFDDLLDDGPSDSDAPPGPGVKRASDESPKKNASAN